MDLEFQKNYQQGTLKNSKSALIRSGKVEKIGKLQKRQFSLPAILQGSQQVGVGGDPDLGLHCIVRGSHKDFYFLEC